MAVNNIWVFAQGANGAPTSGTLELLTKARSLGGTVAAFVAGEAGEVIEDDGESFNKIVEFLDNLKVI